MEESKDTNLTHKKRVEGSFDEGSTSKNVTINAPSTHFDPASSSKSSSVASLPIDLSHSQNETMPGMEILTPTSTNLKFISEHLPTNSSAISHETNVKIKKTETDIEDDGSGFLAPCAPVVDTERDEQIKVNQQDKNPKIGTETNPIVDTTKEELTKGTNGRMEGSTIENANIVTSSIRSQPASSLQGSSTTFLPKPLSHEIKVNQTEKEIKTSPIINLQGFGDHAEQLATASVPVVFTTKDESVVNALADLEVCLKMPLKDIANSEPNCLRLLTAFKFLSCLSFEDGRLSLKLKAITESLLQEFPSILHSYKVALAIVKKFPKFIDEAQEKEVMFKEHISKLEKEMQYDEAKISSLQEKKEKCVAEIREFKKECESMRKQKSEMMKDQRKAQQQLFEVYHKWSVLCSQFQHNYIDVDAHQIVQSSLDHNSKSRKEYYREKIEQIPSRETEVQAASEIDHLSVEVRTNQSVPSIASQNLTKSVEEQAYQSVQGDNISKKNDDKGRIEGSTSLLEAFSHNQIKFKGTEMDIDKDNKAKPIIEIQDIEDDQLLAKASVDLEACLKMPLKDIVTSDSNSLRLHNALNFLFHLSFEDGVLSHGLKDAIQSLHRDFAGIIHSFKPAFAALNKFSRLLNEAQDKEVNLKEQISVLEREIKDCEAEQSSLQVKMKKCSTKMIELNKKFENVRKERSEMKEDQRKAQQQLLQANHRWSVLCSQFQLNIAARNLF